MEDTFSELTVVQIREELEKHNQPQQFRKEKKEQMLERLRFRLWKEQQRKEFDDKKIKTDETNFLKKLSDADTPELEKRPPYNLVRSGICVHSGSLKSLGFVCGLITDFLYKDFDKFSFILLALLRRLTEAIELDCKAIEEERFVSIMTKTLLLIDAFPQYSRIWQDEAYSHKCSHCYLMSAYKPATKKSAEGFTKAGNSLNLISQPQLQPNSNTQPKPRLTPSNPIHHSSQLWQY